MGFRYRARYAAQSLELTGWVENEDDGSVTLEVQGDPVKFRKLFPPEEGSDLCHRFVMHGRAVCNARKPECEHCCLKAICRYAQERSGTQTAGS